MGERGVVIVGLLLGLAAGCSGASKGPPRTGSQEPLPAAVDAGTDAGTGLDAGVAVSPGGPVITDGCPPLCPSVPQGFRRTRAPNPIPAENQKPGAPDWHSGRPSWGHQLQVYTSTDSAQAGETVSVKVSSDLPAEVSAEVYRLGYYGGAGARLLWTGGPFPATTQPPCPRDPTTSLVECHWSETFSFRVGPDWVSGFYVVKILRPDGFTRFAPLVVRDHRAAELLFQAAMNTYQAYNTFGGESLYSDDSGTMPFRRAYQVSYDRPYESDDGTGQMFRYEYPFLQTLEQYGYDVTYGTNLDFSRFSNFLEGIGEFVIAGHDEYWTQEERDQVEAALVARTSVAHFGGNGGYWRVRTLSNSSGTPVRTVACYKNEQDQDPIPGSTVRFRDTTQPENALWGSEYDDWALLGFPLIVRDPSHWLFRGTGLTAGTLLPGLLGYEYDRIQDDPYTPEGLEVPIESPTVNAEGVPSRSQVVSRQLDGGNIVFSAGSIYWSYGLARGTELFDPRVVRMTLNVLEEGLKTRRSMRTLPELTSGPSVQHPQVSCWAQGVGAFAGAAGAEGTADGPGALAHFDGPTGIAVAPDGRVYVADAVGNRIRRIDTDAAHTVTTLAGNGELGLRDGEGLNAMFRHPDGIAVGADGALYVTDSDNHDIRRVETTPPYNVTVYAGGERVAGLVDAVGTDARFNRPTAIAADAQGNLFVADQANCVIRRIDALTREVTTWAGSGIIGYTDGVPGAQAQFNNPSAVVVAPDGDVYVMDAGNQRVRRIAHDAAHTVTTLAGADANPAGYADGSGQVARFRAQMGLALTAGGDLIIADSANFRLRALRPGADAAQSQVCTFAGSGASGLHLGAASTADLTAPAGLAVLSDGRILVSDSYNGLLRVVTP